MPVSQIQNASLASGVPGKANLPTGSVLQVVQSTTTSSTNTSSTSYVDTALTASITPSSSTSKIFVLVQSNIWLFTGANGYNCYGLCNILRGATQIIQVNSMVDCQNTPNGPTGCAPVVINYLDSPATTSSTTYKVQVRSGSTSYSNQVTFNYNAGFGTPTATITLMEIAA